MSGNPTYIMIPCRVYDKQILKFVSDHKTSVRYYQGEQFLIFFRFNKSQWGFN